MPTPQLRKATEPDRLLEFYGGCRYTLWRKNTLQCRVLNPETSWHFYTSGSVVLKSMFEVDEVLNEVRSVITQA